MDWYKIITTILWIVFGFLVMYMKTKKNIIAKAAEKIDEAEEFYHDYTKAGAQKFQYVCDALFLIIPPFMKPFITHEFIENVVQNVFNSIEAYAVKQLDKIVEKYNG